MTGKREFAARFVVRAGLVRTLAAAYSATHHRLKVLAYHRVLPRTDEDDFPYDLELVSAWQEEFEWQVRFLAANHQVITCRDLAALIDAGRPMPRNAVIITFDDGYRDNHDVVLPILKKHGVPAVVFVATGYMDSDENYWYDQLVHRMLRTHTSHLPLRDGAPPLDISGSVAERRQATTLALRHLKTLSDPQRRETLERWRLLLAVDEPAGSRGLHGPMSWAQVRALSDAGIEIGSHSVTHPVLANVADDMQLARELVDSKAAIETHTGRSVVSLAYPVGGPGAYSDHVVDVARQAGYRFGFTYEPGVIDPQHMDNFRLRRLAVERYVSRERFCAMLAVPPMFGYGSGDAPG